MLILKIIEVKIQNFICLKKSFTRPNGVGFEPLSSSIFITWSSNRLFLWGFLPGLSKPWTSFELELTIESLFFTMTGVDVLIAIRNPWMALVPLLAYSSLSASRSFFALSRVLTKSVLTGFGLAAALAYLLIGCSGYVIVFALDYALFWAAL